MLVPPLLLVALVESLLDTLPEAPPVEVAPDEASLLLHATGMLNRNSASHACLCCLKGY